MIKFHNQVPSVYSNASRDFQYLGWLINIVLNSVKHNVDDIYSLPNSKADPKFTELLAMTLGFKIKRNYDQNQLRALVAALPRILKYKGTKIAIDMAGNAILAASGASGIFESEVSDENLGELVVTFPVNLVDISLFTDLLPYILPAGMTCRIIRKNIIKAGYTNKFDYSEQLIANWIPDLDTLGVDSIYPGTANMFSVNMDIDEHELVFSNYIDHDKNKLNIGLLENSIIPAVITPMSNTISEFTQELNTPPIDQDYTTKLNQYGKTVTINKYTTESNGDEKTVIIGGEVSE